MTNKPTKSLSQSRQSVSNAATKRKTAKQKSSTSKRAQSASNMLDEVTKAQIDIIAFGSGLSKGALYERAHCSHTLFLTGKYNLFV